MLFILNEKEYAEKIINDRDLGYAPVRTLNLVARYYYSLGYKPRTIREELEHFLLRCDPDINLVRWSDSIEKAVEKSKKRPLTEIENIPITQREIDFCMTAGEKGYQRLLFTMLCLAKYYNMISPNNHEWVNAPMKSIFALANIRTSRKRQAFMVGSLADKGFISLSHKIDNTNMRVAFIDNENDPVLSVEEFDDLGLLYERHLYGELLYPRCAVCGKIFRQNISVGRPKKYCRSCAQETKRIRSGEHKR